ncbi:MAG: hypothetical protein ACP5IC_01105 [Minisyncoccia bacterium]
MTTTQQPVMGQITNFELDNSAWKLVLLGIITISFALGTGFLFTNQFIGGYHNVYLLILSFVLFLIFIVLDTLFIKGFSKLIFIVLLSAAGIAGIFYYYHLLDVYIIIGCGLFFIFTISGIYDGFHLLKNSLKIKFGRIAKTVIIKTTTGIFLLLSVIFWHSYFNINTKTFNESIHKQILQLLVGSMDITSYYKDFGLVSNTKIDDLLKQYIKDKLIEQNPEFKNYLPEVQNNTIEQILPNIKNQLSQTFGFTVDGSKTFTANLESWSWQKINSANDTARIIYSVIIALLVFSMLKFIMFFIRWLIILLAFLIYRILVLSNFAFVSLENRSREFVALS